MPRLPSHLFVVRHGNRLDAADKHWHLSSATPYDPPLTYGGLLQARQVGNQIKHILEQAKLEYESKTRRHKKFRVVIHTSPFLRCVQTSVGISSGLSQASPHSTYKPSELLQPTTVTMDPTRFKSTLLRIDTFLGEWLSPGYYENIAPPPGSAHMLGNAKANLLKREEYGSYTETTPVGTPTQSTSSLWSASPRTSSPFSESGTFSLPVDHQNTYVPLRPSYAVSSSGPIPGGFVAHARDSCVTVDYRWDSVRQPLGFGDGGIFGEEWPAMHDRFRTGLRKMLNWYATECSPADLVNSSLPSRPDASADSHLQNFEEYAGEGVEDVETVVILVSHSAGCNALIGAITNQPVLKDIGIASITMATVKPGLEYSKLRSAIAITDYHQPLVRVDAMYDLRISASTEHLHQGSRRIANPPARSASVRSTTTSTWTSPNTRGRTHTFDTAPSWMGHGAPISTSSSLDEQDSVRPSAKVLGPALNTNMSSSSGVRSIPSPTSSKGLWTPPQLLSNLAEVSRNDEQKIDAMLPDSDNEALSAGSSYSFSDDRSQPRTPFSNNHRAAAFAPWPALDCTPTDDSNLVTSSNELSTHALPHIDENSSRFGDSRFHPEILKNNRNHPAPLETARL